MRPGWFARQMWPDSPCWRRAYKCGPNGSSRGIAMARTAGCYLAKLARAGLATRLDDGRYAAKAMTECAGNA